MKRKNTKKDWLEYFSKNIDFGFGDANPWTAYNQGATCCPDKHQTFYGAIMKSPQWKAWYEEQMKRFSVSLEDKSVAIFDIDECIGIGAIGDEHLQEFFRFIVESSPLKEKGKDE